MITNAPDLNAPRFRNKTEGTLNKEFLEALRENVKSVKTLTDSEIKNLIVTFNGNVWKKVIDKRDGVDLPEQLGHIFIGTCQPPKSKNVDFKSSMQHLKVVQHRNWESDNYLAKIFFTNYATKYKFKNHELWGFTPIRQFKRTLAKEYPKRWKQYVEIDSGKKISGLYKMRSLKIEKQERTRCITINKNGYNKKLFITI
jgi:hypothetical protein